MFFLANVPLLWDSKVSWSTQNICLDHFWFCFCRFHLKIKGGGGHSFDHSLNSFSWLCQAAHFTWEVFGNLIGFDKSAWRSADEISSWFIFDVRHDRSISPYEVTFIWIFPCLRQEDKNVLAHAAHWCCNKSLVKWKENVYLTLMKMHLILVHSPCTVHAMKRVDGVSTWCKNVMLYLTPSRTCKSCKVWGGVFKLVQMCVSQTTPFCSVAGSITFWKRPLPLGNSIGMEWLT